MRGIEWIVEAYGCSPDHLRDLTTLQALFAQLVSALDLHPCGEGHWHQFPTTGGITGVSILSESHLTCHSFPEFGTLCLNLFCCCPRADWDFSPWLRQLLDAQRVNVRRLERPYGQPREQTLPDEADKKHRIPTEKKLRGKGAPG